MGSKEEMYFIPYLKEVIDFLREQIREREDERGDLSNDNVLGNNYSSG
jgi:hypothetical protein